MITNNRLRAIVAQRFKGRLLRCTLRRDVDGTLHSFEGFRDSFSAHSAARHGVPLTDASIVIIAGSLAVEPSNDDKVQVRDQWFQLRNLVEPDPTTATYQFAAFEIPPP